MCSRTDSCSRLMRVVLVQPGALQDVGPGGAQVVGVRRRASAAAGSARCAPGRAGSRGPAPAARPAAPRPSLICSYSIRRRTSSARGSSGSAPSALFFGGSSMRDLISISIAAISRYSLASSRLWRADLLDVVQVLARHVGQRDVEDVEVLLADQVQQQVQRALEGLEEDLQRVGRDVQVLRQREQRLAVQAGHRHLVDAPRAPAAPAYRPCR